MTSHAIQNVAYDSVARIDCGHAADAFAMTTARGRVESLAEIEEDLGMGWGEVIHTEIRPI